MSATSFPASIPARHGLHLARIVALTRLMLERSRERRILAGLDERMLRDLGITRYDAGMEAQKPFWRG